MKKKNKGKLLQYLDGVSLWWMGILIAIVFFLPYFIP